MNNDNDVVMTDFLQGYGLMDGLASASTNFKLQVLSIPGGKNILYFGFPLWILVSGLCDCPLSYYREIQDYFYTPNDFILIYVPLKLDEIYSITHNE